MDTLKDKLFGTASPQALADFKRYHLERPEIYEKFRKYSLQMKSTGRERYSAKCIMERIRWDHDMTYSDRDFKLSNSMTSMYVRLLIYNHPELIGFFRLKKIRGARLVRKCDMPDDEVRL